MEETLFGLDVIYNIFIKLILARNIIENWERDMGLRNFQTGF
jgi:hypothetical protein